MTIKTYSVWIYRYPDPPLQQGCGWRRTLAYLTLRQARAQLAMFYLHPGDRARIDVETSKTYKYRKRPTKRIEKPAANPKR